MLVDLFTTPGIIGEALRIYLARDLNAADAPEGFLREGEEAHMDIVWAPLDDLVEAVLDGRVHNPTLVAGRAGGLDGAAAGRVRQPAAGRCRMERPGHADLGC